MTTPREIEEKAFRDLVGALKRRPRPVALVGAGVSVDSGYPDWNGLLEKLNERAKNRMAPKYHQHLGMLNDPQWKAEEYRRAMGENLFRSMIAGEFAPNGRSLGPLAEAVVKLRFRHFLTTNYDSCIERALDAGGLPYESVSWSDTDGMREFFHGLSFDDVPPYIVHLHGCFYDPGNVILTERSYAERYVRSNDAARKLFAILVTQPVVFVGFSVSDLDLNQPIREANASLGEGSPHHFALVGYQAEEQKEIIRNRFRTKFGITPVFYPVTGEAGKNENHGALLELLSRLRAEVSESPPAVETLERPSPAAEEIPSGTPAPDPLDPEKGRWGGLPERANRRLRVENLEPIGEWYGFDLVVESTEGGPPLKGPVTFHLHPTFNDPEQTKPVGDDGRARLRIDSSYGVFTVGAEVEGEETRLELDLATVEDFPDWFRAR